MIAVSQSHSGCVSRARSSGPARYEGFVKAFGAVPRTVIIANLGSNLRLNRW